MSQRNVWSLVAMVCATVLSACGNKIEWNEEVKLQNDEIIVVKRTAKSKPFGEIGGSGGWENEGMTVQVVLPVREDNPPVWEAKFVPLLFDRDAETKEWFMVATFYSCTSWYELGRPKLPYTEFRLKGGQWRQQALSPHLVGRDGNMLTTIRSTGEPNHTIASKAYINRRPSISQKYKKVVDNWTTTC